MSSPQTLLMFALGIVVAVVALKLRDTLWPRTPVACGPRPATRATEDGAADPSSAPRRALKANQAAFLGVGLFSGVLNVLMLTSSFYMLEVYDRVLPSRSLPTLAALSLIVVVLYLAQGGIDLVRSRILARIGASIEEALAGRVFAMMVRLPLKTANCGDGLQPARDLDTVRQFLSGLGPTALFDMPWMPLYLVIIYAFHPLLGRVALAGAVLLVALTLLTEVLTKAPARSASSAAADRNRHGEACVRNAEVLSAMGLASRMGERWASIGRDCLTHQLRASDVAAGLGAASKALRMLLQSGMLALGAYLVIQEQATAGVIIAGSIMTSRAVAPVELAIAHWKNFVAARQSWDRLETMLKLLPPAAIMLDLPAPVATLAVEAVSIAAPGQSRLVVHDVSFALKAGQGLGVIGPSASSKSCLIRALVGVWTPIRGKVRLDGAALDQWSTESLGRHIGYLPQDVELFAGTVAENISRFDPQALPAAIIAAARAAGVHELIVAMSEGYETQIGARGTVLSAGQRQRIALARALYGDPFLVVLDEPNSNLDAEGDAALTRAIRSVRERGGIVVVVAHRTSALVALDMVLAMAHGRVIAFGPKNEVMGKLLGTEAPSPHPQLKAVQDSGRAGA